MVEIMFFEDGSKILVTDSQIKSYHLVTDGKKDLKKFAVELTDEMIQVIKDYKEESSK